MQSDILIQLWFGNTYHQAHVQKYKKKTITRWLSFQFNLFNEGPLVLWWGSGEMHMRETWKKIPCKIMRTLTSE